MKRFRLAVLVAAFMTAGVTGALASAPTASATFFSCESCENVSGPNETINRVLGENASGIGLCVTLWLYNGGTSYTELAKGCTSTGFKDEASMAGTYTAHGDVKRWNPGDYHLIGDQIFE